VATRLVPIEVAERYVSTPRPENEQLLENMVDAASAFIIRRSKRSWVPEPALVNTGTADAPVWEDTAPPVAKVLRIDANGTIRVPDLREVVSVVTSAGTLLTEDTYELDKSPGDDMPSSWMDLVPGTPASYDIVPSFFRTQQATVTIVGRWGVSPVPADIQYACAAMAARMFSKKDARWSDRMQAGLESAAYDYFKEMPPDVKAIIESTRVRNPPVIV
jgi:hypothetical protein